MKRLFILSLLLCASVGAQSQDIPKELLKTWMPILAQNYKGDSSIFGLQYNYLISFNSLRNAHFETPGSNLKTSFSLTLTEQDSLIFQENGTSRLAAKLIEFNDDKLVLAYDSQNIITFIPLPEYEVTENLTSVRQKLADDVWTFKGHGANSFELVIELLSSLENPSLVKTQFRNQVKTARIKRPYRDYDDLWMLGSHNGSIVLTIESIFHSEEVLKTLIIKSVDDNEITMAY